VGAPTRDDAARLDAQDPLAAFVDRFHRSPGDPPLVYFDGNSLGPQPRAVAGAVQAEVDRWRDRLIQGWNEHWLGLGDAAAAHIATLVGADPGDVGVGDATTVSLHVLASAALAAAPARPDVITDRANFPTDLYVLDAVARAAGGALRLLDGPPTAEGVAAALDPRVGLVALSHVDFRTGLLHDLPAISAVVRRGGAWSLWDLSHSAGVVPVDLAGAGVDLAMGCTYKYLNGGPGAPSWRYVRGDVADRLRSPIQGWFGHADPFAMEPTYRPAAGVGRFSTGTPPVLSTAAMLPGLEVVTEAGVPAIRAKSVALTSLAIDLADAWLVPLGVTLESPRDPARRGGHIALRCHDARRVSAMLVERHRVIGDARGTDILRLGMSPLGLRFVEVHDGMRRIADAIARGDVDRHTTDPGPVP
jgi:kynureninase